MSGSLFLQHRFSPLGRFVFCGLVMIGCLLGPADLFGQRAKIDSLKSRLPFLHDSARVDDLNALSLLYTYVDIDSASAYEQQAWL
ncbi:MAG TPA: hypothetical protein VKR32_09690, partial [Puia sp.]|nr:hypothetical protein [Puia sp.]